MTANRVQPWLDDGDLRLYHGDALTILQGLPAGIAQTCVTSPPYWGLRDYNAEGQLGLEATPQEYVENMVALFREVRRVLRDDGTLWLNLGDTYVGGLKPKDLIGIPWRVAFALQADGWYLRSDVIWAKPNPMPESITDRPTKSHEYVFLFSKQPRYYYDADAIREPATYAGKEITLGPKSLSRGQAAGAGIEASGNGKADSVLVADGRNRRSVWTIPTQPFPEAHFATYPEELVRPCILAGTSERGECVECGAPWRRVVEQSASIPQRNGGDANWHKEDRTRTHGSARAGGFYDSETTTKGWEPSCQCPTTRISPVANADTPTAIGTTTRTASDAPNAVLPARPQTVLDPFIGSGTTALVARKHGRRCIGIDLSAEYLAIAARRTQQLSLLGGVA